MTLARVTESQSATVYKREQEKVSRSLVIITVVYCNTNFPCPKGHSGPSRASLERGGPEDPMFAMLCTAGVGSLDSQRKEQ